MTSIEGGESAPSAPTSGGGGAHLGSMPAARFEDTRSETSLGSTSGGEGPDLCSASRTDLYSSNPCTGRAARPGPDLCSSAARTDLYSSDPCTGRATRPVFQSDPGLDPNANADPSSQPDPSYARRNSWRTRAAAISDLKRFVLDV